MGRWFAVDPAGQFASPYVGMGNNPVVMIDPDGRWVNIVIGAVVGGVSSYISARHAGARGTELFGYTMFGTIIGATAAAVGGEVGGYVGSVTSSAWIGAVAGGAAAGAVSGGYTSAMYGGDFGQGAWQGALGGAIGGALSMNVPGVIPGALTGAASGGLSSGITAELMGGSFGDGFTNGAIAGGITGGIYGGVAAAQSKYERNIWFGGVTRNGKQYFLNDLAIASDAYSKGLNKVELAANLGENLNGITKPIVNGIETDLAGYVLNDAGAGTKSNVYIKSASLRQMASTFGHEMVHVSDLYSGYARIANANLMIRYRALGHFDYRSSAFEHLRNHLEYRAYQYNINYGYNVGVYQAQIMQYLPYAGIR